MKGDNTKRARRQRRQWWGRAPKHGPIFGDYNAKFWELEIQFTSRPTRRAERALRRAFPFDLVGMDGVRTSCRWPNHHEERAILEGMRHAIRAGATLRYRCAPRGRECVGSCVYSDCFAGVGERCPTLFNSMSCDPVWRPEDWRYVD